MFQHFCVIICLVITSPQFPCSFVYVHVRTFLSIRNNENVIQRASFPSFPTARKNLRHPLCKFRPPHLLNFNLMSRNSRHPLCKVWSHKRKWLLESQDDFIFSRTLRSIILWKNRCTSWNMTIYFWTSSVIEFQQPNHTKLNLYP